VVPGVLAVSAADCAAGAVIGECTDAVPPAWDCAAAVCDFSAAHSDPVPDLCRPGDWSVVHHSPGGGADGVGWVGWVPLAAATAERLLGRIG
jgi:hypothetical protein